MEPAATRPSAAAAGKGGVAVAVVGRTLVGIAQSLVGFAEFFKFILSGMVARVLIRVEFHRQLAVGFFDFVGRGVA